MEKKEKNNYGPFNLGELTVNSEELTNSKTPEKPKEDNADLCPLCKKGQYICDDCRILGCIHW